MTTRLFPKDPDLRPLKSIRPYDPVRDSRLLRASMLPRGVVGLFVQHRCVVGPYYRERKDDLLQGFHSWAHSNGWPVVLSIHAFGRFLPRVTKGEVSAGRLRVEGVREWFFTGITLNDY